MHSVDPRHLQVQNGDRGGLSLEGREGGETVGHALDLRVRELQTQEELERLPGAVVVFGDENPFRLDASPPRRSEVTTKRLDRRSTRGGTLDQRAQHGPVELLGEK